MEAHPELPEMRIHISGGFSGAAHGKVPTPGHLCPPALHPGPDHCLLVLPIKGLLASLQNGHVFCLGEKPPDIFTVSWWTVPLSWHQGGCAVAPPSLVLSRPGMGSGGEEPSTGEERVTVVGPPDKGINWTAACRVNV